LPEAETPTLAALYGSHPLLDRVRIPSARGGFSLAARRREVSRQNRSHLAASLLFAAAWDASFDRCLDDAQRCFRASAGTSLPPPLHTSTRSSACPPACQALGALAAAPHLSQHRALRCWLGAAGLEDEAELLQPLFWEFVVKMFREAVLGCWPELATGVRAGGDGAGGQEVGDRGTRRCASGSGSIRASSQAT